MIGVLAAVREPELFAQLVLLAPSPCYIDDDSYRGGFNAADIEELLESLDSNYLGWSQTMAPVGMGNPERPELGQELTNSFCRTDPVIAGSFARATFLSDHRADLAGVSVPTLVLQCCSAAVLQCCSARGTRSRRWRSARSCTRRSPTAPWSLWTRPGTARSWTPSATAWTTTPPFWR